MLNEPVITAAKPFTPLLQGLIFSATGRHLHYVNAISAVVGSLVIVCNTLKSKFNLLNSWRLIPLLACICLTTTAQAATFVLPKSDVVGQIQYTTASTGDTLRDIARRYNISFNAIKTANPHIDPQRPAAGTRILIPSRHLLPPGPREGIVINVAEMQLYHYVIPVPPSQTTADEAAKAIAAALAAQTSGENPAPITPGSTPGSTPGITTGAITIPPPITPFVAINPIISAGPATPPADADPAPATRPVEPVGPPLVGIYPIGVGSECRPTGSGSHTVEQRLSRPSWTVPASLRAAQPSLPDVMLPGPKNPLGNYALMLNTPGFMIHGTNSNNNIGTTLSRGCISMYAEDVELLINQVTTGTTVRFVNQPLKHGYKNGALYLEFHKPANSEGELNLAAFVNWMSTINRAPMDTSDWQRARQVAEGSRGLAMPVMQLKSKPRPDRGLWLQIGQFKTSKSAHALIKKIEVIGVPLITHDCHSGKPCKVMAGPFKDREYVDELLKKIKWVVGVKGSIVPYQEEDDFQLPLLKPN